MAASEIVTQAERPSFPDATLYWLAEDTMRSSGTGAEACIATRLYSDLFASARLGGRLASDEV